MPRLPHTRERYFRAPHLVDDELGLGLVCIAWGPGGEAIVRFPLDRASGEPAGESVVLCSAEAIIDCDPADPRRAADASVATDDVVISRDHTVLVERRGACSDVWLERGKTRMLVWSEVGCAAAPSIGRTAGGDWIAFHHNVREDDGRQDLAKWVALRFVDPAGRVFAPAASAVDANRDQEGEEQSFEFPSIVVAPDGAVGVFGRGSHRFWSQRWNAAGVSPREPLGEGGWGCRGRRVSAVVADAGRWLTARREKAGIELAFVEPATGGAPALVPITVRHAREAKAAPKLALCPRDRDGSLVLFGDLHQHSAHSDGIGTVDEPYRRARFEHEDDFCALSDHESFIGKRTGPGEWAYLQAAAERHDAPGEFATLFAYEWTAKAFPGPGHKCVYFREPGRPILSRDDVPEGRDLVARVRALGGIAVPHHVGWTGSDEGGHDPVGQPVWEICSCHGCYEDRPHPLGQRGELGDQTLIAALRRGLRFGFIACSDGHGLLYHHGIARKRDPYRTGLTAVIASTCTRQAVFDAIASRRCYATSGAKIVLDVRVGGAPMGSALPTRAGLVDLDVDARGTGAIGRIVLVGASGELDAWRGSAARVSWQTRVDAAERFAYVRVEQADGEMAWSSPVFFG